MRVLVLRQKILFASQEAESGLKYDPALVQSMFLHTVLTGLQSDSVKVDMQPLLLNTKTTDEALLEKLNIACANKVERQKKKKTNVQHTKLLSMQLSLMMKPLIRNLVQLKVHQNHLPVCCQN